jgi:PAS domain S-box-containing protein
MTKVYIIGGPMKGECFELKGSPVFIGRTPDNDIQIRDLSISRRHLKITRQGTHFYVEDMHSRNGTFLKGDRLEAGVRQELREGLPVALGNTIIRLADEETMDGMVTEFSINVREQIEEGKDNPLYRDRRITNRGDLELICDVSNTLMRSLDISTICEKIMDVFFSCFKRIDSVAILLMDNRTGELDELITRTRNRGGQFPVGYSRTIVNRVLQEGKAVMMSDTSDEDEHDLSESIGMMRIKSIMCVPLVSRSRIRGVIYAHSVNVPQGFRKDDLFLLTALSGPVAVAIENALLYSQSTQSEEALRRSEQKYRTLLENIGDMVFTIMPDGRLTFGNPRTESLTGYPPEQLVGKNLRDLVTSEFLALAEGQLSSAAAGEAIIPFEIAIFHASGQKVEVELTFTPLRGENGVINEIQGVARDIGERKRAEELTRYKELFESVAEGVFIFDSEEKFLEANDIVRNMLGYSRESLLSLKVRDILQSDMIPKFEEVIEHIESRKQAGLEMDIKTRTDTLIPADMIFRSIFYLGRPAVLCLARDITQTKLLQDQLIRSERLAASGQLAASIAHEINSPLQAIGVLLTRLKQTYPQEKDLSENVDILMHGFHSIRDTVRNLLDLNRPGMEDKRLCNVNTVIEKTVALVQGHLKKNRVRVELNLDPEIPLLKASPQQLGQVFMNLIMNAVQAMSGGFYPKEGWRARASGGGEIRIASYWQGSQVKIQVTDTGPGIASEEMNRIFDPFYTRKRTKGMGIGLSICYGIIESHGGRILAGNAPEGGAVFEITLPSEVK